MQGLNPMIWQTIELMHKYRNKDLRLFSTINFNLL